ncbi:bacteriocin biosynthesis cyclodehydratase domain-containing protein [Streptomyces sp. WMMB 714]|uniref:TOMM precursor leader peptide-binding protein n=1 Tax=Streptomyces sp. WMMB 714 TaxID=1286822 RepID=UPI0005F7DDF8|nr:TOMM precursor leader peptide-binding protein [Streptomyces sp. WMMB 714]SCK07085.1 bacteriocin biosynthesis cyclodehydratase domain-containing protein [Streptomyces sp. WMMB 714]
MATAAYEAVAATRPRIRRDVLYTETPEGVLFHNADGGFQLTAKSAYRFATLIVPHLDGSHSVSEISEGFGDRQRAMLGELVKTLYARGFARDVPEPDGAPGDEGFPTPEAARRFAPQIAYVDHYADDAERRFERYRSARVAVLGEDEVARWCVLSLIRNGSSAIGVLPGLDRAGIDEEAAEAAADGCPVQLTALPGGRDAEGPAGGDGWAGLDSYDVVLVTGGPLAAQRLFPLLKAGIPKGPAVIAAWSYGQQAVVGPLMAQGRSGCFSCAVLRLGAGDGAAAAADVWSALAMPGAVPAGGSPGGPLAAMTGNMLGYEVFRFTTGALRAETDGQLIVQDTASLDVTSEPLLPHPRCTMCSPAASPSAEISASASASVAAAAHPAGEAVTFDLDEAGSGGVPMPTVETARDADGLVEELNRRSVLVREHAGVFKRFGDEALTQLPLKAGIVELGVGHGRSRAIAAFDTHHVAGARMRALNAAAAVYAEHVVPCGPLVPGGRLETARESMGFVAPGQLTTASGTGAASPDVAAWTVATSLVGKEQILVPEAAVRTFTPANSARLFEATSAGTGAGASPAEAAARGLLSALGHDALLRTVRGAPARRVEPAPAAADGTQAADGTAGADAELTFLARSLDQLGLDWELLDLREESRTGVHVFLARAGQEWALGSETGRTAAASAALRDLLGRIQLSREEHAAPVDTGDPLLRDLAPGVLPVEDAAGTFVPGADGPAVWSDVLERLRAAGRDALVVPTGSADLQSAGISTVRVLLTRGADHAG